MENENHFYSIPEAKEKTIKEYSVNFFDFSRPEAKQAGRSYDTDELVTMLNKWWQQICAENNVDPEDKKFKKFDYYLMELGKNALEYADGGEIKVIFETNKITAIVTDDKGWDGDPNDDILYGSPGHGLSVVKSYADEFIIETNGVKFTKAPKKRNFVKNEDTDIKQGTKITFIKNFE